jgi:hypothetical protein
MRRRGLAVGGVLALAALAALTAWAALATGVIVHQEQDVAIPPRSATPTQVVRAYVEALDAHDCDTARALGVPDWGPNTDLWCDDVRSVRLLSIDDDGHEGRRRAIGVRLDISWRLGHDDGTIEDAHDAIWGYVLCRTPAGWRICNEGQG